MSFCILLTDIVFTPAVIASSVNVFWLPFIDGSVIGSSSAGMTSMGIIGMKKRQYTVTSNDTFFVKHLMKN
jgi:hypothetical protein